MASRSAMLGAKGTRALLGWIAREDSGERFEIAAQEDADASLAREGVPLEWVGAAGADLGLRGPVGARAAARVLVHGRGPGGEELRTRIAADPVGGSARERRVGVSWVVSTSKSVSLLLASRDPAVRAAVRDAVDAASAAAMSTLESTVTVRRGKGGRETEGTRGLLGVRATHLTSSAGDPHLHVHFVLNASAPGSRDGRWVALDGKVLFTAQRIAEGTFQARLRAELTRRLALRAEDWWPTWVGSVPVWELRPLAPASAAMSRASDHMRGIAERVGVRLGGESAAQHALVWGLHRQGKRAVAEELEHALDAALAEGGTAAEALRGEWRKAMGFQRVVLGNVSGRPAVLPASAAPDPAAIVRGPGGDPLFPAAAGPEDSANPSALVASWAALGFRLPDARRLAAEQLAARCAAGTLAPPEGMSLDRWLSVVRAGRSPHTDAQHQTWGYAAGRAETRQGSSRHTAAGRALGGLVNAIRQAQAEAEAATLAAAAREEERQVAIAEAADAAAMGWAQ